jgi:hypothetical protein
MAKLPHYRNSTAAMKNYEPVYLNLFEITIQPPNGLANWNTALLMEQVIKVSGLDVDKTPPAGVQQTYKGWTRSYANAKLDQTFVDIAIDFEVNLDDTNSMYMYRGLKAWCSKIFDPLTGAQSLKADYAGGPMVVSIYNRQGDIFRQYTFPVVWPTTNINALELDYNSTDKFTVSGFTFRADYFNDVAV